MWFRRNLSNVTNDGMIELALCMSEKDWESVRVVQKQAHRLSSQLNHVNNLEFFCLISVCQLDSENLI